MRAQISKIMIAVLSLTIILGVLPMGHAYAHDGDTHDHGLTVEAAWAPHTGKRKMSAAIYLRIINAGTANDALVSVHTPVAMSAALHTSRETDDGIMRMEHLEQLVIPARGTAMLSPGKHHIMLMRLKAPLKRGEVFPLTLSFKRAGDVVIFVEITGIGGPKK
jgi:periplasmic copper chaperone A